MNFQRLYTLLFFLTTICILTTAQHRVVRLTDAEAIRPAEVSIAINPTDPDNIIGTSIQYGRGGARVNGYNYITTDGGRTWKNVALPNPRNLSQGDDAITFSSAGVAYHSYMSFEGIRTKRPARAFSGLWLVSSKDKGATWSEPVPVIDHINSVTPFEDKPYVVTDNVPGSPHQNNVWLAWTRFDEYGSKDPACHSHIFFSRSIDGGKSFAMPIRISDSVGDCLDDDNTVEGAIVAAGVKGEVYVIWSGPQGLVFDKSLDGGLTFGKDKVIAPHPGGWSFDVPGINRCNGMPVTKVDFSNGPNRGTIYLNWIDERNGDPDVFVRSSRDGGETWSPPVRVNDDKIGNGKAQFLTWLAVDPMDGSLNLVFYDRRNLEGTKTGLTLARSVDGGKTFVNYKINLEPFESNQQIFFGDYNGIDAFNGLVTPIFTHFIGPRDLAVSAAFFKFKAGTQEQVK
jgi:hypothetical protein